MRELLSRRLDGLRETLLYQVSNFEWARLLWNVKTRNSILALVTKQHGRAPAQKLCEQVSLQVLRTSVREIQQELSTNLQWRLSEIDGGPCDEDVLRHSPDASKVFIVVSFAASVLDLIRPTFQNLSRVLLLSLAHATLLSILDAEEDELSIVYRTRVDFIRQHFDDPANRTVRDNVINAIKKAVSKIHRKDKAAANSVVLEFAGLYALDELRILVNALLTEITVEVTPLRYFTRPIKTERKERISSGPGFFSDEEGEVVDNKNNGRRKVKREENLSMAQPAYFSDVEEVGGDRMGRSKHSRRQTKNNNLKPMTLFPQSERDEECPLRGKSRTRAASNRPTSEFSSDGSGADYVAKTIQGLSSHFYPDCKRFSRAGIPFPSTTSSCSDIIDKFAHDHLSKSARTRGLGNSFNHSDRQSIQHGEERVDRRNGDERNVSDESDTESNDIVYENVRCEARRNGTFNGKGADSATRKTDGPSEGALQVEIDSEAHESDTGDDEGALDEVGKKIRSSRWLRKANRALKRKLSEDPLDKSLQDAAELSRKVKRRKSRQLDLPSSGARDASPLPETPSSLTKRRRRTRIDLSEFVNNSDEDDEFEPVLLEDEPCIGGMKVARGRFTPQEDDWLVEGLQKYGWGSWAVIAKNFGHGKARHTRNGVSLKDRARTLQLDPASYTKVSGRLERRGRKSNLTPVRGKWGTVSNDGSGIIKGNESGGDEEGKEGNEDNKDNDSSSIEENETEEAPNEDLQVEDANESGL